MQTILDSYTARNSVDRYAYQAGLDKIRENDFNLNLPRYVDTFEEEEIDIQAVQDEIYTLEEKFMDIRKEMDGSLKELGFKSDVKVGKNYPMTTIPKE